MNKLLVEIDGQPMVRHAATAMLEGGIRDLVVVTGHQQDRVKEALNGLEVAFIHNADFDAGQAGSVAAGVAALPDGLSGALIALGDMPFVTADLVAEMIRDHSGLGDGETRISFPVHEAGAATRCSGAAVFRCLRGLSGDVGGRTVLAENPAAVNSIGWHDDSIHRDIDTPRTCHKSFSTLAAPMAIEA